MKNTNSKTLVLTATDIESIVLKIGLNTIMDHLIERMSTAFQQFDPAKTNIPVRAGFHYDQPEHGLIEWMPLYESGKQVVLKIVGYHPDNPDKYNLPSIISTISNYDTRTGHLKAIIDGVFLTALRTGAASAVASRLFAKTDSRVLGLIGCGAQSVTQLHALSRLFTFEKVLFFDIDRETQNSFTKRIAILELEAEFIPATLEEMLPAADILCTATSIEIGKGPLFGNLPTKAHLHINALGSDFPGKTELPISLLRQSFVCPDFIAQAKVEGECQQLKDDEIKADIFECMQFPEKYQHIRNERSVFDSTGLPLEDQVVMDLFLDYANTLGLGTELDIERVTSNAKNPYQFMQVKKATPVKELLEKQP